MGDASGNEKWKRQSPVTTVRAERQAKADMSMSSEVSILEMLASACDHLQPRTVSTCERWREAPEQNIMRSESLEFLLRIRGRGN